MIYKGEVLKWAITFKGGFVLREKNTFFWLKKEEEEVAAGDQILGDKKPPFD